MKTLLTFIISLSCTSFSFSQGGATSIGDTSTQLLIPSIIVKCMFDKELGWHQAASLAMEDQLTDLPIDSVHLIAFDTTGSALDTVFNLSSNRTQVNSDKHDCWTPQFLEAAITFYKHDGSVARDMFPVQVSILENSKKCACGTGKGGKRTSGSVGFDKVPLSFANDRNKAEHLRLNKKKYTTEFIEYNYAKGKLVKVDDLSRVKGKIYIDESHLSTGFSRNNNFPEAAYRVLKNEKTLVVLMAESRRADGDLLIWKVVIQSGKMDITASWYRAGELKTTYLVKSD